MCWRWKSLKRVSRSSRRKATDSRDVLFLIVLVSLSTSLFGGAANAGIFSGSVAIGFDSFSEKYSIVDADTLDQLNEFRTRLRFAYSDRALSANAFQVEGTSLIGQQNFESAARIRFGRLIGANRFSVDTNAAARIYFAGSRYSFPNDFFRLGLRARYERIIRPGFTLRLTDRLEGHNFAQRTEFDYDYVRNVIQLATNIESDFTTNYHASVGYVTKAIPDSAEIAYESVVASGEFRYTPGLRRQFYLTVSGERRFYRDPLVKSPFWAVLSTAQMRPVALGDFGMGLDNYLESYLYDRDSDAFFDYLENRLVVYLSYQPSFNFRVTMGPTYVFFASPLSIQDEYREVGARVTLDYSAGSRLWFSASYEPGIRNYLVEAIGDAETIFSDYLYNRVIVYATARLWEGTSLNLFLDYEPEDHKREADDATATLFSVEVSYGF